MPQTKENSDQGVELPVVGDHLTVPSNLAIIPRLALDILEMLEEYPVSAVDPAGSAAHRKEGIAIVKEAIAIVMELTVSQQGGSGSSERTDAFNQRVDAFNQRVDAFLYNQFRAVAQSRDNIPDLGPEIEARREYPDTYITEEGPATDENSEV